MISTPANTMCEGGVAGKHTSIAYASAVLAGRGRLRGVGHLHLVSFFPEPGWGWEDSRAFWQCSLLSGDLFGLVLYHSATARLSVPGTSQSEWRRD